MAGNNGGPWGGGGNSGGGGRDEPPGNLALFAVRTLRNAAIALMTGGWRKTPFFNTTTGLAVSKPVVLSADERAAAYKA